MSKNLKARFEEAMYRIYSEAKEDGLQDERFFQMLDRHGGLRTAKALLNRKPSPFFYKLCELKRFELTVEFLVLQPDWKTLFTCEEKREAKKRLVDCGYPLTDNNE